MTYRAVAGYRGEQVWTRYSIENQGIAGFLYHLSRYIHDHPDKPIDRVVIVLVTKG